MPHMFEDKPADEPMIKALVTLHTMKKTDLQQRIFRYIYIDAFELEQ